MGEHKSRAERMRMPIAKDVVRDLAQRHGVCIRPVPIRRIDLSTGEEELVDVPCGHTRSAVCPPCAERKKKLRMAQCREGWHLEHEPIQEPDQPTKDQRDLVAQRSDVTAWRDARATAGDDTKELDEALDHLDGQIRDAGVRGTVEPAHGRPRRTRSTRRRQDTPDLPRKRIDPRTVGKAYTAPDGKVFRPSIFLTTTCDSYGPVRADGTPVDPDSYDYTRAARDALHFAKLADRFIQNLRRVAGYDVQYFATVEPQKRLAPHLHLAMRGTISRAEIRQITAATYHQVWWPSTDQPVYTDTLPVWDADAGYVDPDTGAVLPSWDEALDAIGDDEDAQPAHVVRFGPQVHAEGVLAGTEQAGTCIGYLAKYLTKSVDECHEATTEAQHQHVERLVEALRFEPCSPTCANWLRFGVQPKDPRSGMRPGYCNGKAHKPEHLGYAGRRVLVSRKWSGKTLADHRHDRRAWVLSMLGVDPDDPAQTARYTWQYAGTDDPDVEPLQHRLLRAVADRSRWRNELDAAKARAAGQPPPGSFSATEGVAA